jgi:hypothetical protein
VITAYAPGKYAYAAGLVGQNFGNITNCYSAGVVISSSLYDAYAGGLVGEQYGGSITNCHNMASVASSTTSTSSYSRYAYAGGLIGEMAGAMDNLSGITNCYNTGSVASSATSTSVYRYVYAGGLVGFQRSGTIINCYNMGATNASTLYGTSSSGGIAGWQEHTDYLYANIEKCYSIGAVSATGGTIYKGGLLGYYGGSGTIADCFWDMETSGMATSAGGSGVAGKTTAEMKTLTTFTDADWDFIDVWNIGEWQTYPYLRKYQTGDLDYDGVVNMLDFAVFAEDWLKE